MTYKEKTYFAIKRFLGFIKIFLRNKRGTAGLLIISAFVFVAVFAPLITPYDHLGERPGHRFEPLSGFFAAPSWLRHVPAWLGGIPGLSENMEIIDDPECPQLVENGGEWNFTAELTDENIWIEEDMTENYPYGTEGCLAVTFHRDAATATYGEAKVNLWKEFYFPYSGPPDRLSGFVALLVKGMPKNETEEVFIKEEDVGQGDGSTTTFTLQNAPVKPDSEIIRFMATEVPKTEYTINYTTGEINFNTAPTNGVYIIADYSLLPSTIQVLAPSVIINVYVEPVGGKRWNLWPPPSKVKSILPPYWQDSFTGAGVIIPKGFTINDTIINDEVTPPEPSGELYVKDPVAGSVDGWIIASDSPTSQSENIPNFIDEYGNALVNAEAQLFAKSPRKYILGVEIIFIDEQYSDETVETTVCIDNFWLKLWGTSWGILGTDKLGRDLFAQIVYGTRVSLYVGLLAALLSVCLGLLVGLAAGYLGRVVDEVLMRFNDMLLTLPTLPLMIVLVHVLGARIENIILLIGFLGWQGFARTVRSQVLSIRERPFIEAATAVGAGKTHIIIRHVLPNVMGLVYVTLATAVPGIIVLEASLAWLGLGDPNRMSWGMMLHHAQLEAAVSVQMWWWTIPPGLLISILAVAFILLGFALDDILNPKLRVRR